MPAKIDIQLRLIGAVLTHRAGDHRLHVLRHAAALRDGMGDGAVVRPGGLHAGGIVRGSGCAVQPDGIGHVHPGEAVVRVDDGDAQPRGAVAAHRRGCIEVHPRVIAVAEAVLRAHLRPDGRLARADAQIGRAVRHGHQPDRVAVVALRGQPLIICVVIAVVLPAEAHQPVLCARLDGDIVAEDVIGIGADRTAAAYDGVVLRGGQVKQVDVLSLRKRRARAAKRGQVDAAVERIARGDVKLHPRHLIGGLIGRRGIARVVLRRVERHAVFGIVFDAAVDADIVIGRVWRELLMIDQRVVGRLVHAHGHAAGDRLVRVVDAKIVQLEEVFRRKQVGDQKLRRLFERAERGIDRRGLHVVFRIALTEVRMDHERILRLVRQPVRREGERRAVVRIADKGVPRGRVPAEIGRDVALRPVRVRADDRVFGQDVAPDGFAAGLHADVHAQQHLLQRAQRAVGHRQGDIRAGGGDVRKRGVIQRVAERAHARGIEGRLADDALRDARAVLQVVARDHLDLIGRRGVQLGIRHTLAAVRVRDVKGRQAVAVAVAQRDGKRVGQHRAVLIGHDGRQPHVADLVFVEHDERGDRQLAGMHAARDHAVVR